MTEIRVRRYAGALLLCTATVSVADASLNTAQIVPVPFLRAASAGGSAVSVTGCTAPGRGVGSERP